MLSCSYVIIAIEHYQQNLALISSLCHYCSTCDKFNALARSPNYGSRIHECKVSIFIRSLLRTFLPQRLRLMSGPMALRRNRF